MSEGVQNAFTELKYNLHSIYQIEPLLVLPFGNPCARIALVLNDASCNQVEDATCHVPYGIEKSGLTAAEALIWPFDPRSSTTFASCGFSLLMSTETKDMFNSFNRKVLEACPAQIVLLVSGQAEQILSSMKGSLSKETISNFVAIQLR